MKIIEVVPKNTYTCQGCLKEFKTMQEYHIEPSVYPVCSKRCEYKVIYRLISWCRYEDKTLELMQKIVEKKDKIEQFSRQKAIFSITKHYAKIGLASIKWIGTRDRTRNEGTKKRTKGQRDKNSPPIEYRGIVPCPVPSFSPSFKSVLVPSSKSGGLKEWF